MEVASLNVMVSGDDGFCPLKASACSAVPGVRSAQTADSVFVAAPKQTHQTRCWQSADTAGGSKS